MSRTSRKLSARLMCGAAAVTLLSAAGAASAAEANFDIPPQQLAAALKTFSEQSGSPVLYRPEIAAAKVSAGASGAVDPELALNQLLEGTQLSWRKSGDTYLIVQQGEGGGPQSAGAGGDVDALIVTAQKREENIQDVPIAISAFSQEDLTTRQVAGGPDLMTQVPNFTFTKTNFSGYSIQIRGIGTQAISATTDPAVAIAFNNTPFVRNRFFEQEFYDLQRVEVLRGPQGTLYGRNATAGVVNIISAKPTFRYEARASADVSNYNSSRVEGMINLPLVEDVVALRLAGAWTKRDGFVTNEITGNPIDGRDLWSTRLSLRVSPTDNIDVNLIWEHFQEDDDRLRSGKQLCHTDVPTEIAGFTEVAGVPISENPGLANTGQGGPGGNGGFAGAQGVFSQGCAPASLYAPESFQTPNGYALPYYVPLGAVFLPTALTDPYVSRTQSNDLRVIESTVDPGYKAETDVIELQLNIDLSDTLSLSSETAWASDFIFSTQDYNRFNTASGAWDQPQVGFGNRPGVMLPGPTGGIFCDPQIGCADRLVAVDLSTAKSRHFSQEFRLASDFDGPFNFSLGANFLRYDTEDKYYVFINSISIISALSPYGHPNTPYVNGVTDNHDCLRNGPVQPDPTRPQPILQCTYIDPNPIGALNDLGHNYFLSRNPYKLISYAAFGEVYYNITDTLKVTGGLRFTVDKKEAPLIPSWLLASNSVGYPVAQVIEQEWNEPTGRLTIDWKPDLSFTDDTLLYVSFAHGYKAGGTNPPLYGVAIYHNGEEAENIIEQSAVHPKTFEPEFVNALELGAKNTLADGRVTLNLAGFYYDYKGYQISQIVDRSATNMNFDAAVWGLEVEADWRPLENLRLGFKGGYEHTEVADGERAIDIMDRTAGHDDWLLVRPFPSVPSNCILPAWLFVGTAGPVDQLVNLGGAAGGNPAGCELAYIYHVDPVIRRPGLGNSLHFYDNYPGWDPTLDYGNNQGQGFFKDLSGNELPNAPHYTATITADYTLPLPADWLMTLHADLYYQSEAWTRIFNMEGYDKLKAYTNVNFAAIFTNDEAGWKVMAYVKNVMDRDSITGAFLNSDDSGLTTNVFLTEPRLYGLRVTKEFDGGPWWTGAGSDHPAGEPYPLTIELGGQVQRQDAPYDPVAPSFSSSFRATLDPLDAQNQDLDWGDGREVKVTYALPGGQWRLSGGVRIGKANGANRLLVTEVGEASCGFYYDCPDPRPHPYVGTDYTNALVVNREEHTVVDFQVGREVGLGGPGLKSAVAVGLRYAELESRTQSDTVGVPDWDLPAYNPWLNDWTHHRYEAEMLAQRRFEGAGPTLSWESSKALLGNTEIGHVDLAWTVEGGVLFGKQKTFLQGEERALYFSGPQYYDYNLTRQVGPTVVTPISGERTQSVTVPVFAASLGLSYEIQRIKVGAGYRWERYFDVLDAGFMAEEAADRDFDGPYFKVSVGFGG